MDLVERIRDGEFQKVIICSGAGVSTEAGIPDYRSEGGAFQLLSQDYPGIDPQDVFSRWFQESHPEFLENPAYLQLLEGIQNAEPTPAHQLAVWLNENGWLKRVYTQNVDGLYTKAGLPKDKLVEFHGSIESGVVLYDDPIPDECILAVKGDHMDSIHYDGCDLMLVMGTSLQVAPFCAIPNMVPRKCTRAYVDLNPSFSNSFSNTSGGGMYSTFTASTIKFYQNVSLEPKWGREKYKKQYIIQQDCSEFSLSVLHTQ